MIFQVTQEGEEMGILKVVECHGNNFSPASYGDIISKSVILFREIGEDDGWDVDDLDDFVQFHNLRSVVIIERIFIEDVIEFNP